MWPGPRLVRMDRSSPPTRRQLLAGTTAVGTAVLAGCSLPGGSDPDGQVGGQVGASDVVALNNAPAPKRVSVTIADTAAETPHTSRTLELAPNERVDEVNDSKLPMNTSYTVAVDVVGGPDETFEWTDPTVERAPLWVVVDGSANIRFLLQAG